MSDFGHNPGLVETQITGGVVVSAMMFPVRCSNQVQVGVSVGGHQQMRKTKTAT